MSSIDKKVWGNKWWCVKLRHNDKKLFYVIGVQILSLSEPLGYGNYQNLDKPQYSCELIYEMFHILNGGFEIK